MIATSLLFDGILEVVDVFAVSVPSNARASRTVGFFLGVDKGLKAHVEGRVGLQQIYNIEFVINAFFSVGHSEEVPLSVSSGVVVIAKIEIVLVITDFLSASKVARFKP